MKRIIISNCSVPNEILYTRYMRRDSMKHFIRHNQFRECAPATTTTAKQSKLNEQRLNYTFWQDTHADRLRERERGRQIERAR